MVLSIWPVRAHVNRVALGLSAGSGCLGSHNESVAYHLLRQAHRIAIMRGLANVAERELFLATRTGHLLIIVFIARIRTPPMV